MKKPITLIASMAVASAMFAQEQPVQVNDAQLKDAILFTLLPISINLNHDYDENGNLRRPIPTVEQIAKRNNIPHEQMTRVLEEMVRERLLAINNGKGSHREVSLLVRAMQTFHGPNTIALLRECMATPREPMNDNIFYDAVQTYLVIEGAEAIPFLREAIAKRGSQPIHEEILKFHKNVTGLHFTSAAQPPQGEIQKAVIRHIQENKTADADKLMVFLKELGIPEPQEPPKPTNDVTQKDEVKQEEQQEEKKEE